MKITIGEIAKILDATFDGDEALEISGLDKIEEAAHGRLSFLANEKYESFIYNTSATAVLVSKDFKPKHEVKSTLIRVDNVYSALGTLMNRFQTEKMPDPGISSLAFVNEKSLVPDSVYVGPFAVIDEAQIGEGCIISSHVFIGKNCSIGKNVKIYSGVKIYADTVIGDEVVIHANAVIGSDGFGFAKDEQGKYLKMSQNGNVVIEDNVEIGSNTVIDRASIGSTIIRKGVKLDNLIQVAHNVEIGANTVMAAQAGIAGSTKLGKNCMIGGQVGFVGHLNIADGAQIQAQSGVAGSVKEENAKLYGYPAIEYNTYLRAFAQMKNLPEMAKKLRVMEKELEALKTKLKSSD